MIVIPPPADQKISLPQAASELGVSSRTLRRWIDEGSHPPYYRGAVGDRGHIWFWRSEVVDFRERVMRREGAS